MMSRELERLGAKCKELTVGFSFDCAFACERAKEDEAAITGVEECPVTQSHRVRVILESEFYWRHFL